MEGVVGLGEAPEGFVSQWGRGFPFKIQVPALIADENARPSPPPIPKNSIAPVSLRKCLGAYFLPFASGCRFNRRMDTLHSESDTPDHLQSAGLQFKLSEVAARALGCLLEKELCTPDAYPLTLNALVNACNQRSNRDPIMALSTSEVEAGVDELRLQKLAVWFSGADSRVPKFKHKLEQVFAMDETHRAAFAELLLRGPQTAAQLRANAQRMTPMPEAEAFDSLLEALSNHPAGQLVKKLPRQLGKKEARWAQLLTGEPTVQTEPEPVFRPAPVSSTVDLERRVADLELMVQMLQEQMSSFLAASPPPQTQEEPLAEVKDHA